MLDLALFAFVMALLAAGVRRPFIWVMAYIYIDVLVPQKIGWSLVQAIPLSLIAFAAAFAGWLLVDDKTKSRFTYRQFLMVLLLVWCAFTTYNADFPEAALEKWTWVWKALIFAIFLPLTLTTRLRFESALLTMILALGAIVIGAGIKTIGSGGGGYGKLPLLVDADYGLYETSTLACVAIASIPLIRWLVNHGTIFPKDWRVQLFSAGLIFACLLIPVGTAARTGLICIAALGIMMLRDVKKRFTYLTAVAALVAVALPFLPQTFYERMSTIGSHEGDESASTRVAVWNWTLDYTADNPGGGGFNVYMGNSFTYKTREAQGEGNNRKIVTETVTDKARAFHSSYFEMLGEQGVVGFLVWILLQISGVWQMERLRRRWKDRTAEGETWQAPLANALQLAQITALIGSLFVGIAYQPYVLLILAIQCGLWSYCRRTDSQGTGRIRHRSLADSLAKPRDTVTAGSPALQ